MHTLGALFEGIIEAERCGAARERAISGIFDDSRRVQPGGMFVALRGTTADGRRFVQDALARGANVIVGESLDGGGAALTINVEDARQTLARLASRWYGLDRGAAAGLKLVGITGTNGKSTTAHMTREILRAAGLRCGMLGTVQYDLCSRSVQAEMTTPGPLDLAKHLRECADAGARAVVMEVSSHALDQRRVAGLNFAAAAFTNLTQDHLDYHHDMSSYAGAKARLFAGLGADATAVVNQDDPAHERMIAGTAARVVTYGLDPGAELRASISRDTVNGTLFRMPLGGRNVVMENALVGRHNVYNALAAVGLAQVLGVEPRAIEEGLAAVRNIPGRLQRVPGIVDVDVFVDYAHTPDALANVARVLRPLARGRLVIVFGCGGDRDRGKRPLMAQAAAEYGHALVITSDNPRTEDPQRIIDEIVVGLDEGQRRRTVIEPDRRTAIQIALAGAAGGDIVLIAGKGHENYQIVGHERREFDDVAVAIEAAVSAARAEEKGSLR